MTPGRARGDVPARGVRQRLYVALRRGTTLEAAAAEAGVSVGLARVVVDEFTRLGLLARAESLCTSGLGACGGGDSPQVRIHCAGCPLSWVG